MQNETDDSRPLKPRLPKTQSAPPGTRIPVGGGRLRPAVLRDGFNRRLDGAILHRASRRRSRGFTLIEMIVAAVLLFIGVVAAMSCIAAATRSTGLAGEYGTAASLAQRRFAEIEASRETLNAGEQQGDFAPANPEFAWQQVMETTEAEDLMKVTIRIAWNLRGASRSTEFATYLRQPEQEQQTQ